MITQETGMLYKLIILYTLSRLDFPLSNNQIIEFLLEKEYANYFIVQQTVGELVDDSFIIRETHYGESRYTISEEGMSTLTLLKNELSQALRDDIDAYIFENKYKLRDIISTTADYYMENNNCYTARLSITENKTPIIRVELSVNSEEEAEAVCGNWKVQSSELYPYIMRTLLKR